MKPSAAGKGDDYRPVNGPRFRDEMDRIFKHGQTCEYFPGLPCCNCNERIKERCPHYEHKKSGV